MSNYWEVPAYDFIKEELTEYAKENNLSSPQEVVDKLLPLLPSAYEEEVKTYAPAAKAWMTLQISKQSSLAYHKSEDLGEFIYDTKMYKVMSVSVHYLLQYIDNSELEPILPIGLKSCSALFMNCKLPKGFTLGDKFDTSKVTHMNSMFADCTLPEGFTLGDKFDTSSVTDMSSMFWGCEFPQGFTLGDKFDTSKVTNMNSMFFNCKLPEGFTLGDKFNTSNVEDMDTMFCNCILPQGFTLGNKFDTNKVTSPESVTIGGKTIQMSKVHIMVEMFSNCTLGGEVLKGKPMEIVQKLSS